MPAKQRSRIAEAKPPAGFRVARKLPLGRHPLLAAFPGLDRLATARRFLSDPDRRAKVLDETCVMIVDEDLWMYVAPWDVPGKPRGWRPVVSPGSDCIVIGKAHLRESSELMLFMDIFHELCHVRQRQDGAEIFDRTVSYVRRVTEIEAYRFAIDEGRRVGASNEFLRDYLHVEWIDDSDFRQLLDVMGVSAE